MFLNTAVAVLPSLSTPCVPTKSVPLALTTGFKTLSPPPPPIPLAPFSFLTLSFCSVSVTFTVFQRLSITSAEGPAERMTRLQAVMLCGDSADWMWHLKLPWSDYAVITYACIIYKQDGTAKFNSQGKVSSLFLYMMIAGLWQNITLISRLKSDVSGLSNWTWTYGFSILQYGRHIMYSLHIIPVHEWSYW